MDVFPAGFPLHGLCVGVAGEGAAAEAKARLFAGSPARLKRVASADAAHASSYAGVRLAFIALEDAPAAARAARAAGALVNVVDRPELCDFTTPAIVDRGAVVGAVMTGGAAPLLAAELRRELEALWPPTLGAVAGVLQALQPELRTAFPMAADRRAWLRRLLDGEVPKLALRGETDAALALARRGLASGARAGRLSLLVPPASPDLLSLRALQALGRADRLVVADGVDPALLAMARRDAPVTPLAQTSADQVGGWVAEGVSVVGVGPQAAFAGWPAAERLPVAAAR